VERGCHLSHGGKKLTARSKMTSRYQSKRERKSRSKKKKKSSADEWEKKDGTSLRILKHPGEGINEEETEEGIRGGIHIGLTPRKKGSLL